MDDNLSQVINQAPFLPREEKEALQKIAQTLNASVQYDIAERLKALLAEYKRKQVEIRGFDP